MDKENRAFDMGSIHTRLVMAMDLKKRLTERFLRYAAVSSQSEAGAGVVPSTPGQRDWRSF